MTDEQYKKMTSAAEFFNETARKFLVTEYGLHAETLISRVCLALGVVWERTALASTQILKSDLFSMYY
jgi:hypothetical protein